MAKKDFISATYDYDHLSWRPQFLVENWKKEETECSPVAEDPFPTTAAAYFKVMKNCEPLLFRPHKALEQFLKNELSEMASLPKDARDDPRGRVVSGNCM